MTQKQANTLNMHLAVIQYLDNNKDNWNSNSIITKAVNSFQTMVANIQKASLQQNAEVATKPAKNEQDKEQLINLSYKLALRVKNYAVSINNTLLKQSVDFSKNELEAGKEKDIIQRCESIINKAKTVTAAPAGYKITLDFISKVEAALRIFSSETHDNNKAQNIGSSAEELENLFNKASSKLHILDDLIEADADDNTSVFVRKYFITRRTNIDHKIATKPESNKPSISNDDKEGMW